MDSPPTAYVHLRGLQNNVAIPACLTPYRDLWGTTTPKHAHVTCPLCRRFCGDAQ